MAFRAPSLRAPVAPALLAALLVAAAGASADAIEEVVVIGVTPSHGAALPEDRIPYNVQSATADDIERSESLDLSDFLNRNLGSVTLNDAQNNPLQPDLQYRGFTASPLLGLAQGLAVYQNGVRINEPLGDTINWDLLPEEAIHSLELIGGANPVFGLNTLGGALSVRMKDGFNAAGHGAELWGGSFERVVADLESGGNNGTWGYYVAMNYLDEDGWRDLSPSDSLNLYGTAGWRGAGSALNLNLQHGESNLYGNGPLPAELLAIDRETVFTAPDITDNDMVMVSVDGSHAVSGTLSVNGTAYFRRNETDSFNGDGTEMKLCDLGGSERLLEGLEDDDLEALGLDDSDICAGQFADADALEEFLDAAAGDDEFDLDDLTGDISGSGVLSDQAINNSSSRVQKSRGFDAQVVLRRDLFGRRNQFAVGGAWYRGTTRFDAVVELARFDPATRSSLGLGTGAFLDAAATSIHTATESWSVYFTDTIDVTERLAVTVSGRYNNTAVDLADRSGARPELNGEHDYSRFNPAVGATYTFGGGVNLYAGYSESARAPTPIELSCNEYIFERAVAAAIARGDDADDVEFECRLPNAFLADPPLDQVVAKSWEAGVRGTIAGSARYRAAFFHTVNSDDIIFQSTGRATGLFANVDETRRMGFEGSLLGTIAEVDWFASYSWVDATFQDDLDVLSPNHDFADDEEGTIHVQPGNRIPGVPAHQLKAGADLALSPGIALGVDVVYNSGQYLRGDESNQLDMVDGYAVVNLRARWAVTDRIELLGRVTNLFDADYETFGLLGEEPSGVKLPEFRHFTDPRFFGPGAPRAGFVGIRVSLD
jgi:outer membrane receptor protein involved in Fe transport